MPAITKIDDLRAEGFKGVNSFEAELNEFADDVKGKFGLQVAWHYEKVSGVDVPEGFDFKDDLFTAYAQQKSSPDSTYGKLLIDWTAFAATNDLDLDNIYECFYGLRIRFERVTYENDGVDDEGKPFNPGTGFVPVELLGGRSASDTAKDEPEEETSDGPSDELVAAVVSACAKGGATPVVIQKAIKTKKVGRDALAEYGSIDKIIEALAIADKITVDDDGVVHPASEGEADDPF